MQVQNHFKDEILGGPTVLFGVHRDYLIPIRVTHYKHPKCNLLAYVMANTCFEGKEQENAMKKLEPSTPPTPLQTSTNIQAPKT